MLRRIAHHPLRRHYVLAIAAGLIAEGLLAVALYWQGTPSAALPLLFLLEAAVLGIVFGPGPGIAGACAPVLVYLVAEWVRRAFDIGAEPEDTFGLVLVNVIYLVMVFAFFAGMAGVLRNRWFGPPSL